MKSVVVVGGTLTPFSLGNTKSVLGCEGAKWQGCQVTKFIVWSVSVCEGALRQGCQRRKF